MDTWMIWILIWCLALILSFWQGFLAKQSLEQAKETKNDTERLLDEIKSKVSKVEIISDETRKDVKEQISKMIDKNDENFKTLLENNNNWFWMEEIMKMSMEQANKNN